MAKAKKSKQDKQSKKKGAKSDDRKLGTALTVYLDSEDVVVLFEIRGIRLEKVQRKHPSVVRGIETEFVSLESSELKRLSGTAWNDQTSHKLISGEDGTQLSHYQVIKDVGKRKAGALQPLTNKLSVGKDTFVYKGEKFSATSDCHTSYLVLKLSSNTLNYPVSVCALNGAVVTLDTEEDLTAFVNIAMSTCAELLLVGGNAAKMLDNAKTFDDVTDLLAVE